MVAAYAVAMTAWAAIINMTRETPWMTTKDEAIGHISHEVEPVVVEEAETAAVPHDVELEEAQTAEVSHLKVKIIMASSREVMATTEIITAAK